MFIHIVLIILGCGLGLALFGWDPILIIEIKIIEMINVSTNQRLFKTVSDCFLSHSNSLHTSAFSHFTFLTHI